MSIPITVAYGDGIGPEIMEAVLHIFKEAKANVSIETVEIGEKIYQKSSFGIMPSAWESIERTKILLKAPTTTPQGKGHKSLNVTLRKRLGLYANVRPCISYYPIIETKHPNLNVVIVRENEEDLYTGVEHRLTHNSYECTKMITKSASERICNYAFAYAKQTNRKKVTCLIKDNIMKMTDGIFHESFKKISKNYPEIISESYIVDIGMAKVATVPEEFDVIVTLNLYGDIVSDIVAQLSGSIGMAGSANIGSKYAMFEAVHGSAPDIAGQNIANPSGLLSAAIEMLVHINQIETAQIIHNAWLKTLEDGIHTADIYNANKFSTKKVGTAEFAEAIIENLGEKPQKFTNHSLGISSSLNEQSTLQSQNNNEDIEDKKLVGADISLSWNNNDYNKLISILHDTNLNSLLELVSIYVKGLSIWPSSQKNITEQIEDYVTCRFYINKTDSIITNKDINSLLSILDDNGFDVIKMTKLYLYNDKPGFFVV